MFGAAVVTAEQLGVLTTAITDNLAVIIPVGLGILAIMIGVGLIPKIIHKIGRV